MAKPPAQSQPRMGSKWEPPEEGWFKTNSDGTFSQSRDKGGAGVVLRDSMGAFRAAACHVFSNAMYPEKVELLACPRAIQVTMECNVQVQRLHLELDNMAVVAAINNQAKDLSVLGTCTQEIKGMLQHFMEVKVTWVSRDANSAADKLAKLGLGDDLCKVWFSVPIAFWRLFRTRFLFTVK